MMKKLKAFSLVEMLITLIIMAIVMLMATETLNTIFRASTMTKLKTTTRNEIGFAVELTERLLANSNVTDVYIFNTSELRRYNEETGSIVLATDENTLENAYLNGAADGTMGGTEIHVRPYGYRLWVCLAYFRDANDPDNVGYFIKRTTEELPDGHESCFNTDPSNGGISTATNPLLVLNSQDVTVNDFKVSYIKSSDINNVFYVDFEMEPTHWIPGENNNIERSVFRQAIITTQGLTWY